MDIIFADLSRHITLLDSDVVEVQITGVSRLSNTVQEVPSPTHGIGHAPTDSDAVCRVALGRDFRSRG